MSSQPRLQDIEAAASIVHAEMSPTAQLCWPMLCDRLGTEVWVKHENQTPVGAFKIRGGLVYFEQLEKSTVGKGGVISATRGNHGQSIGFAARRKSIRATIVVPHGNSTEKNAAMRALGVQLIEQGEDFQDALETAVALASDRHLHLVPSFHPLLVAGVATYSLELFRTISDFDVAYVPIGMGSGICGMIAVRDALRLKTRIVGVVSSHATAYAKSFAARESIESPVSTLLADGMACRKPQPDALQIILGGCDRIVQVSDAEVAAAMRTLFECTHNTCEGAGSAALAAATKEKSLIKGQKVAVVVSGGNVDRTLFAAVLSEEY
jgi:threonine dehydratase